MGSDYPTTDLTLHLDVSPSPIIFFVSLILLYLNREYIFCITLVKVELGTTYYSMMD